jgi:tRNA pseudouridine38-40 synthase
MPRIAMVVEYDGSGFCGWQYQPLQRSIQGEISKTLNVVLREYVGLVQSSGRTDAGVHAAGQVISFKVDSATIDCFKLSHSVSSLLRGEVAIIAAGYVPDVFHPRRNVQFKEYCYRVENRKTPLVLSKKYAWHVPEKIDWKLVEHESRFFVGEHDFTTFRAAGHETRNAVRTIYDLAVVSDGCSVEFRIKGTGFLKHMVRIIVGTLIDIGRGKISRSVAQLLLDCDRGRAGITAPPHGLKMSRVRYEDAELRWLG